MNRLLAHLLSFSQIPVLNSAPLILENKTSTKNNWVKIDLIGTRSTRDAVGSLVTVRTNQKKLVQEVHRGRGYQSHYGSSMFFGLADAKEITEIEVRWHGGGKQVISSPSMNSTIRIHQVE